MKMTMWMRFPLGPRPERQTVEIRGVDVLLHASRYDMPQAFRGVYQADRGVFRIEFRYVDVEPSERCPAQGCVTVEVGLHSHKLLAIEVAVDEHRLDAVRLIQHVLDKADKTVEQMIRTSSRHNARLNYGTVEKGLHRVPPEQLLAAL